MCSNETCPMKGVCYRARATPSCWQSYANFQPKEDGECEHFWPTLSEQARREKENTHAAA